VQPLSILTIITLTLIAATQAVGADKPTDRSSAEGKTENVARYQLGGFGANATASLGINVKYPTDIPQGITILGFEVDSKAKEAGIVLNDVLLEVDGSPVGFIRGRYYEPWTKYGRSGDSTTELLISYSSGGERKYYYPDVKTSVVAGEKYMMLPPDFFIELKPKARTSPEDRTHNVARYVLGYGNFSKYAKYELGAGVTYSYGGGATIATLKPGGAAAAAGLKVGDHILEVDGAPVGVFGDRVYEVWRQYVHSKDEEVEFLVAFDDPSTGQARYYYPKIKLTKLTTGG